MTGARRQSTEKLARFRLISAALRALVLTVLSVGYLVPALHFTLVQHDICAEHGQLHHSESSALVAASPPATQSAGSAAEAAPRIEHEHEHCGVVATSSNRLASSSRSTCELAAPLEIGASPVPRADASHSCLALLAYAPKLAPPS